jgi:hypothetical protein
MGAPLARDLEHVAHETLAPDIVVRGDAHGTVDVEPVACRRQAPLTALEVSVLRIVRRSRRPREECSSRERELNAPVDRL